MECHYRAEFLKLLLDACYSMRFDAIRKEFTVKNATFVLARVWDNENPDTLKNLWLTVMVDEREIEPDFEGFLVS